MIYCPVVNQALSLDGTVRLMRPFSMELAFDRMHRKLFDNPGTWKVIAGYTNGMCRPPTPHARCFTDA